MKLHKPPLSKRLYPYTLPIGLLAAAALLFGMAAALGVDRDQAANWISFLTIVCLVPWVVWRVFIREGHFTWRARASGPLKAHQLGQHDKADKLFLEQMQQVQRFDARDFRRATILTTLADYLATVARFQEAKPLYQEALRIFLDHLESRPSDYLICLNNLAVRHLTWFEFDSAKALLDQGSLTLQPFTWDPQLQAMLPFLHGNRAAANLHLGDLESARVSIEEGEAALPQMPSNQQSIQSVLLDSIRARRHILRDELDEADAILQEIEPAFGPIIQPTYTDLLIARGQFEKAERSLGEGIANFTRETTPDHPCLIEPYEKLTRCLLAQNRASEAVTPLSEVRAIRIKHKIPITKDWLQRLGAWAPMFRSQGFHQVAAELEAEAMVEGPGSTHFRV